MRAGAEVTAAFRMQRGLFGLGDCDNDFYESDTGTVAKVKILAQTVKIRVPLFLETAFLNRDQV